MKKIKKEIIFWKPKNNMSETGGSRENNIEADAYAIFPEVRTSINKFKPKVSNKDNKNVTRFSSSTIEK